MEIVMKNRLFANSIYRNIVISAKDHISDKSKLNIT